MQENRQQARPLRLFWAGFFGMWFGLGSPLTSRECEATEPRPSASNASADGTNEEKKAVEEWLQKAREAEAKGDRERAKKHLSEGRQRHPGSVRLQREMGAFWKRRGDEAGKKGDTRQQREMYQKAVEEDPRLLEDQAFVGRYRQLQRSSGGSEYRFKTERVIRLGIGLTGGIEGIGGLQVSLFLWGLLQPLVTFAPGSPSLDFSFRVVALRGVAWSPYIGGGVMLPLRAWSGLTTEILPEAVLHLDLGVHFLGQNGFSFSGGLSFCYNLDPKGLWSFLPLPSLQIAWIF